MKTLNMLKEFLDDIISEHTTYNGTTTVLVLKLLGNDTSFNLYVSAAAPVVTAPIPGTPFTEQDVAYCSAAPESACFYQYDTATASFILIENYDAEFATTLVMVGNPTLVTISA